MKIKQTVIPEKCILLSVNSQCCKTCRGIFISSVHELSYEVLFVILIGYCFVSIRLMCFII